MQYQKILPGIFLSRPNRFVARVEVDGAEAVCHVKNTGRCRELLVPGARIPGGVREARAQDRL